MFFGDLEYVELSKDALLYFGEDKAFFLVYDSAGGSLEDDKMELDESNGRCKISLPTLLTYFKVEWT